MRIFHRLPAPRAAAITGAYLIVMSGIAVGTVVARHVDIDLSGVAASIRSLVSTGEAEHTLDGPAKDPAVKSTGRPSALSTETPRLVSRTPAEPRIDRDFVTPEPRVAFVRPPADRPVRPVRPATPEPVVARVNPHPDIVPEDKRVKTVASIRPKARPISIQSFDAVSLESPHVDAPTISGAGARCQDRLARSMPRRSANAPGGRDVLAGVKDLDGVKRDRLVAEAIIDGNMPDFLRDLVPVSFRGRSPSGEVSNITICVTPDYLAVGDDTDYVRVPMGLRAATRIGERFEMILPTPLMVDLIYRAAEVQLAPQPMEPGPQMTSTNYLIRHNDTVQSQVRDAGADEGMLVSGHKKDVVLTSRLTKKRGRVAIYGWHRTNGKAIQPLSTVHGAGYADYSHGVRLVSRTAYLNGYAVDLQDLMADPDYAALLSREGPIGGPDLRMAALAAN